MSDIPIVVTVDASGAISGGKQVERSLGGIEKSADRATSATNSLRRALSALTVGFVLRELQQYADTWTLVSSRIKLLVDDQKELVTVQRQLFDMAQNTRTAYGDLLNIYGRFGRATKSLGYSQKDVLDLTETVTQAVQLSGATAYEAGQGLIQFSQALASGRLQGDEFRSVMEALPGLAQAIAEGMGKTVREMYQLRQEGKLTIDNIVAALRKQAPVIAQQFAQLNPTIGQGFVAIGNSLQRYIGEASDAFGITRTLYTALRGIADNFQYVAAIVLSSVTVMAGALLTRLVPAVRAAWAALSAFATTNPLAAALIGVAALATALTVLRHDIVVFSQSGATLGDTFSAAMSMIADKLQPIGEIITAAANKVQEWTGSAPGYFASAWDVVVALTKSAFNNMIAISTFGFRLIANTWEVLPEVFESIQTQIQNGWATFLNGIAGALQTYVNFVREGFQLEPIVFENIQLPDTTGVKSAGELLGGAIAKTAADSFKRDFIGEIAQDLEARAAANKLARDLTGAADADLSKRGTAVQIADPNAAKELEKFKKKFNSLINEIDNVAEANRKYKEGEEILNSALKRGLITTEQKQHYMERLAETYRDARDPLAAVQREFQREIDLMGIAKSRREVEKQLLETIDKLKKAGIKTTQEQNDSLREQITTIDTLQKKEELRESIYSRLNATSSTYKVTNEALNRALQNGAITAQEHAAAVGNLGRAARGVVDPLGKLVQETDEINRMFAEGVLTVQEYQRALRQTRQEYLDTQRDFASGVERGLLGLLDDYEDYASQIETMFKNTFSGLEDVFADFTKSGKLSFQSLAESIISDLTKIIIRATVLKPLVQGFLSSSIGTGVASFFGSLPGFATGGSFTVGSDTAVASIPGRDNRLVAFRARDGENVSVSTPGQQQGGAPTSFRVVMDNQSGHQLEASEATASFNGEEYVLTVVINGLRTNKYGLRTMLQGA